MRHGSLTSTSSSLWQLPVRRVVRRMIDPLIYQRIFGGTFTDRQHALAVFARHIQEVRERVPREKLPIYE